MKHPSTTSSNAFEAAPAFGEPIIEARGRWLGTCLGAPVGVRRVPEGHPGGLAVRRPARVDPC